MKLQDIKKVNEADAVQIPLDKAFGPGSNEEEQRRSRMRSNFSEELQALLREYAEGAETFGEFKAPGIVSELEKELKLASFRNLGGWG